MTDLTSGLDNANMLMVLKIIEKQQNFFTNNFMSHESGADKSRQTAWKFGGVALAALIGYGLYSSDAVGSFGSANREHPAATDTAQKTQTPKNQPAPNPSKNPTGTVVPRTGIIYTTNDLKDGPRALTEKPYTRSLELEEIEQNQELRQEAIRKGKKGKGVEQEPEVYFEPI